MSDLDNINVQIDKEKELNRLPISETGYARPLKKGHGWVGKSADGEMREAGCPS